LVRIAGAGLFVEDVMDEQADGPGTMVPVCELRSEALTLGVRDLAHSVRRFGVLVPITIDLGGRVIDGHRRVAAARLVGLQEVPAVLAFASDCA
jgi:hypothetical protein